MRGIIRPQEPLFASFSVEERIPEGHPLRKLREVIDVGLKQISPVLTTMYAEVGRPSIPPEQLLRATIIQVLYSIRSERLLVEQLDYNFLFRWFVGLSINDRVWEHSTFSKNRDRLMESDIATEFLSTLIKRARTEGMLSDEHFTVDGTLIEAWASQKSFQRKDAQPPTQPPQGNTSRNANVDFHGDERTNDTHASTTDPDARLYRKSAGVGAKLVYMGHVLMDNLHGLVVSTRFTHATGRAERAAAVAMMTDIKKDIPKKRFTLGCDKAYDVRAFRATMRREGVTLHAAQNTRRPGGSSIDKRTTRHEEYEKSLRERKRVEEIFGWNKTVGPMRKIKLRGLERGGWLFTLSCAVLNAVRIRNHLCAAT